MATAFEDVADLVEPGLIDVPGEPDMLAPVLIGQVPGPPFEPFGVRVGGKRGLARTAGTVERLEGREGRRWAAGGGGGRWLRSIWIAT